MTELEKMLQSQYYNGNDKELMMLWQNGQNLISIYNNLSANDTINREKILAQLLGQKGNNLWIVPPFFVDYGFNIYIGNNCEINMNCTFLDDNRIILGNNVLIAPNVQIYTASHPLNSKERFNRNTSSYKIKSFPVKIGDNTWVGGGSIILPGVTIGDNVVIGAGSVVTKSVPDNTIAYGNPCRIIRKNL